MRVEGNRSSVQLNPATTLDVDRGSRLSSKAHHTPRDRRQYGCPVWPNATFVLLNTKLRSPNANPLILTRRDGGAQHLHTHMERSVDATRPDTRHAREPPQMVQTTPCREKVPVRLAAAYRTDATRARVAATQPGLLLGPACFLVNSFTILPCFAASTMAAAACCALSLSRTALEAFLFEASVAAWLWCV